MENIHALYLAKIGVPQNDIDDIINMETPENSEFIIDDYLFTSEGQL